MSDVTAVPLRPVGKSGIAALWAGVALLLAGGAYGAYVATTPAAMMVMPADQFLAANAKRHGVQTTASGLEYQVIEAGSGPKPTTSDMALVEYRGSLTNGNEFQSTKPGEPVPMAVGQSVPGFKEALSLMSKGARYRVWIPPQLGYGEEGNGPIPPHAVLVFDLTLVDFQSLEMIRRMQQMQAQQQPGM